MVYDTSMGEVVRIGETINCTRCNTPKPAHAYYERTHNGKPRQPCKQCISAERRARYAKNGEHRDSYTRTLDRAGATITDYEAHEHAQAGRCATCHQPETTRRRDGTPRRLTADIRPDGTIRALLCLRCATTIRTIRAQPGLLDSVTAYLNGAS
jgi:hypothetical protein